MNRYGVMNTTEILVIILVILVDVGMLFVWIMISIAMWKVLRKVILHVIIVLQLLFSFIYSCIYRYKQSHYNAAVFIKPRNVTSIRKVEYSPAFNNKVKYYRSDKQCSQYLNQRGMKRW